MPTALAARYEAARGDSELVALRDELALTDSQIGKLLASIETGPADEVPAVWEAINGLIEQRRRLADSERKRLVDMQQMVTAEQAALLIAALTDSVRRHVDDPDILAAIVRDVERITAGPTR